MYGIARWYIASNSRQPVKLGATFISNYATYLGVDPQETLYAVIHELGVKQLRLVSYWNDIESSPGEYNFSDLDWQFKMAEEAGVKVSLAIGLRQPRWPECHMPEWASKKPITEWSQDLNVFITKVVERYRNHPALQSYQLENEYFLAAFGKCPDHSRPRLVNEFSLVRSLDPTRQLIVTRSNNAVPSWPIGDPRSDINGASIYKRVWDKTVTKRYFEYPVPAWFYAFLAGGAKITTGRDTFIHELQAESWTPPGYEIKNAPLDELYKSMTPTRLKGQFAYSQATGMKSIDLWGVEWWYQMKIKRGEPGLWNTARQEYQRVNDKNTRNTNK